MTKKQQKCVKPKEVEAELRKLNKVHRIEIQWQPGEHRGEGGYEVFTYDVHNTCLDQQLFRYGHRSDKRRAMNQAISHADKEAKPGGIRVNRLNF